VAFTDYSTILLITCRLKYWLTLNDAMDDGCSDGHVTQDSNDASDDVRKLPM